MKRILSIFLLFCLLLAGCGTQAAPAEGYSFSDDLDRTVTVENPQRVAVLLGSFAQVWHLAGGTVCAAPDDAWEDLDLDLPEEAVNLGSTEQQSLELLLSAKPDLILASTNRRQNMQWLETLEATGIPTAYFGIDDFDDYLRMLKICTDLTGRADLYEKHGLQVQQQIDAVIEHSAARGTRPTVLCLTASAATIRAQNSEGTVLGATLKTLGCENIADSDTMLLENLSLEHILVRDPDFIFLVQRGDDPEGMQAYVEEALLSHPLWSQLTAVKTGQVHYMDKALFNLKPNHRWGEAYEILEEILENDET